MTDVQIFVVTIAATMKTKVKKIFLKLSLKKILKSQKIRHLRNPKIYGNVIEESKLHIIITNESFTPISFFIFNNYYEFCRNCCYLNDTGSDTSSTSSERSLFSERSKYTCYCSKNHSHEDLSIQSDDGIIHNIYYIIIFLRRQCDLN